MSLGQITHEENSKRKTHRIRIPIKVIINNLVYEVSDWSMNGMKILLGDNKKHFLVKTEDTQEISIVLNTGSSSIVLNVEITIKNVLADSYGVLISKINDKNKKVLRHYASLAIDGNIEMIDDLSGNLFMNNVASPITEPIALSDKESVTIQKSFLKRVIIYLIAAILFVFVTANVLFYNYVITNESVGVISGNSVEYLAPYKGSVKDIYVKRGESISPKQVLFEMDDSEYKNQIAILEETQEQLKKKTKLLKRKLIKYREASLKALNRLEEASNQSISLLKSKYETQEHTYQRAKKLYQQQLISLKEFNLFELEYLNAMSKYESVVHQKNFNNKNELLLEQNSIKNEDYILRVQSSLDLLNRNLSQTQLEIKILQAYVNKSLIVSSSSGTVYKINKQKSNILNYSESVLLVQTDTKPFILTKTLSQNISSIEMGAPVIVYSAKNNKIYYARVRGIGYPSIDGIKIGSQELSQNEIPIKIEFDDENIKFDLNEYVEVYITNSSFIAQFLLHKVVGVIYYND